MNDRSTRFMPRLAAGALLVFGLASAAALAQPAQNPQSPTPQQNPTPQQKPKAAADQGSPSLSARLVEVEKLAKHGGAAVEVEVIGLKIIDPATVAEKPSDGQGHLHYQIDDGPMIATTATQLSFHNLKPGPHKLKISLAANDHSPIGQPQEIAIPGDTKGGAEGKGAGGYDKEKGKDAGGGKGKDKDKDAGDDESDEKDEPVAQAKEKPTLTAKLVDESKNTARKALTVEVTVAGIEIIDPLDAGNSGKGGGQAHVHYALDDGPVIATSMKKLSYHGLRSGPHKLKVVLATNDHKPLGTEQTIDITIP